MNILDVLMILRLQIGCFCLTLFVARSLFTVKRTANFAYKLFRYIIIIQLFSLAFDMITVYTVNRLDSVPPILNKLCHILFISSLCFFIYLTFLYIRNLVTDDNRKIRLFTHGFPLIISLFSIILAPLYYVETEWGNYSAGPGATILYCVIGIYLMVMLYIIIRHWKEINADKRRLILIALVTEVFISLIQLFIPTLLLSSLGTTLIMLAIYLTIENPDRIMGMVDALTQCPNRRRFNEHFEEEWKRAIREKTSLGIMIIDADNFKKYNDTYGHSQGDALLQTIAQVFMQATRRPADMAARWGGEEFVVLLPNTDMDGTFMVAENIRKTVASLKIPLADGMETGVTVSIGINSELPDYAGTAEEFICKADIALYEAKNAGKNTVMKSSKKEA